jgi:hypothetical protein
MSHGGQASRREKRLITLRSFYCAAETQAKKTTQTERCAHGASSCASHLTDSEAYGGKRVAGSVFAVQARHGGCAIDFTNKDVTVKALECD